MRIYIDRKRRSWYTQCDMCNCVTGIAHSASDVYSTLLKAGWILVCGDFPDKDYCPVCSASIFKGIDLKAGPETYPCIIEDSLIDAGQEARDLAKKILDKLDDIDKNKTI